MIWPEHYKGASNELKVASYYLQLGWSVYFPFVQQGHTDFIVEQDGDFLRVQVKTATWVKSGPHSYLQCRTRLTNMYQDYLPHELYDTLAVIHENDLWLIPSTEILSSNLSLKRTSGKPCAWDDHRVLI